MRRGYWHQRAATWVSASVLVGGLVSSVILFMLVRLQNRLEASYPEGTLPTAFRAFLPE
jgi:uncharacterized membrane protein